MLVAACHGEAPEGPAPVTVRCAVIGGMVETGFWPAIAARFERLTGNHVELASSGPKPVIVDAFRKGGIDLITVHASDSMVNLVADGLAVDPQPWARNDLVIVGPHDDPAHIRGGHDAIAALAAVIAAKSPWLIHASMGADGVVHDLLETGHLTFAPGTTILFEGEDQHAVLDRTAAAGAYTLIGRIPFISGKLKHAGIELMVQGDPQMRRPYLVAVGPHASSAARDLAAYLREPDTQAFIATFGKGRYDAEPLFFPVTAAKPIQSPR